MGASRLWWKRFVEKVNFEQCTVIAPVCVFIVCVCLFVCGSALLQPAQSVCVASECFFIVFVLHLELLLKIYVKLHYFLTILYLVILQCTVVCVLCTHYTHQVKCIVFRLDALALSVIATATCTWLGGWLGVCHSRYCIKKTKPI